MTTTRSRPPIDPRIRERRIEVSRRQGRRRLTVLLAILTVVGVLLLLVAATRSSLLDVDHIVIAGLNHTGADDVVHAARLDHHRLMIDVHADVMSRRIDRLPWVDRSHVDRGWPGTVRVTIRERVAVASLPAGGGGWALADRRGRVLARQAQPGTGLPQVTGGPPAGAVGSTVAGPNLDALAVAAALPTELRPKVPAVLLSPEGIELKLVPIGVAKLGSTDQLTAKLDAVITMMQRANLEHLAVLDVRVPSAPVLTRG